MDDILRAATRHEIHGEEILLVHVNGNARDLVRSAPTTHYPVLVLDTEFVLDTDFHHPLSPSELMARAETFDVEGALDGLTAQIEDWRMGTGDEGYHLDSYDVAAFGEPQALVLLPRTEPWSAFAYLNPYGDWLGLPPELLVSAARRWHDRHGAEPTVVDLACGFKVAQPPTDVAGAERLAREHEAIAALTAGTTLRAYARALMQLDHWTLYTRP